MRTAASATPSPTTTSLADRAEAVLRANWREGVHGDGTPYAYTDALRETLAASFEWWASLSRVYAPARSTLAPALTLGTSSAVKRFASPWLMRAGALAAGDLLRLDLHPADLDHPRHIGAVEGVLQRAHRRVRHAVTYDDLAL